MAYNIIELNEKLTTELRVLAKEMGIRRPDAYKKEELIYKILDEQAIAETKKITADLGAKQNYSTRNRIEKPKNQKNKPAGKKEEIKDNEPAKKEPNNPVKQAQPVIPTEKPRLVKKEEVAIATPAPTPTPAPAKPEAITKHEVTKESPEETTQKEAIADKKVVTEKAEAPQNEPKTPSKPIQLVFRSSKHKNEEKNECACSCDAPPCCG